MHSAFDLKGERSQCRRYELVNGVIVPANGAEFSVCDPWEAFRTNIGAYRTVQQPYAAFLELHRELEAARARDVWPTPYATPVSGPQNEADELVLNWCNEHGLLGVLPVLANSIRFRVTYRGERVASVDNSHHLRRGGSWSWSPSLKMLWATPTENIGAIIRQFADEEPKPGLVWLNLLSQEYEAKPLEYLGRFFPSLKDPLEPPCPNTDKFWASYGEPCEEIAYYCELFASAVERHSKWEKGNADKRERNRAEQSHQVLNSLAETAATTSFRFNMARNVVDEEMVSPGLLASYALMFLWDRVEGRRALHCDNCKRYFVSNEPRGRYCSRRCRNTAQSRRYRIKKRTTTKGE